jgi:hypothetical protein
MVSSLKEIANRFRQYFAAAEAFARIVVPDDSSVVDDLWSHWGTPARFAAKHPDWYLKRWHLDVNGPDLDWWARDVNPWSHLQDCLGVRGLLVVVRPDSKPAEVMAALDASKVFLPDPSLRWGWTNPEILGLGIDAFLTELARHIRSATDRVVARMCDAWSDDYVLTTLPLGDLPTLKALALDADIYEKGLQVLGR